MYPYKHSMANAVFFANTIERRRMVADIVDRHEEVVEENKRVQDKRILILKETVQLQGETIQYLRKEIEHLQRERTTFFGWFYSIFS